VTREQAARRPPAELLALVEKTWAKHCGKPGHVTLRLNFGHGTALSVRVETPVSPTKGEWETIICGPPAVS
jgi:hypothetical protein